mgnify:CR=1 FL=1
MFSIKPWFNVSFNGSNKSPHNIPMIPKITIGWTLYYLHKLFKKVWTILPIEPPADINNNAKERTTDGNNSDT